MRDQGIFFIYNIVSNQEKYLLNFKDIISIIISCFCNGIELEANKQTTVRVEEVLIGGCQRDSWTFTTSEKPPMRCQPLRPLFTHFLKNIE